MNIFYEKDVQGLIQYLDPYFRCSIDVTCSLWPTRT